MWDDTPQKNRNYIWENFANGSQVLFMDPYLVNWPKWKRNLCLAPVRGIGTAPDPRYDNFRDNLGYLVRYSRKLNLAEVTPRGELSFDGLLSRPDPRRRGGVPRLRPRRGLVHAGPLRHAELPKPCRRMVRPGEREDDHAEPRPRRIVLPVVPRPVPRRCGVVRGGCRGPQLIVRRIPVSREGE